MRNPKRETGRRGQGSGTTLNHSSYLPCLLKRTAPRARSQTASCSTAISTQARKQFEFSYNWAAERLFAAACIKHGEPTHVRDGVPCLARVAHADREYLTLSSTAGVLWNPRRHVRGALREGP